MHKAEMFQKVLLLIFLTINLKADVSQPAEIDTSEFKKLTAYQDLENDKSSLVFVFDATGSMYDDLEQLRNGAEMILETALEDSNVIEDFVFVPFRDPGKLNFFINLHAK